VPALRLVFFGTPEFAVPSLARVVDAGFEVPLVVTQPDRPVGRHSEPRPSAVARAAADRGLRIEKPERLRGDAEFLEAVRSTRPDAGIVVAYGKMLPQDLLDIPPLGFVNVHGSLLPKHRGASPVQAAILAGDSETGVTTMKVVAELDSGPIYLERRVAIGEREDAGSLSRRLAGLGADLLVETLRGFESGELTAHPQNGTPTFCRSIRREDGRVDWSLPAEELDRRLRAFTPWPGLYTFHRGERIKILSARPGPPASDPPGTIRVDGATATVAAGQGSSLVLESVQREGRRAVSGAELARSLGAPPVVFES
jgi:methionyl-tRNA formyltransferase